MLLRKMVRQYNIGYLGYLINHAKYIIIVQYDRLQSGPPYSVHDIGRVQIRSQYACAV